MADHETVRCPTEATICHQGDRIAKALTHQCSGDSQHFAHPRTAFWPLVTNDDDITSFDIPVLNSSKCQFF